MSDVTLSYKGSDILELSDSGSATLKTGGTYCEADIELEYVKPSGGGRSLVLGGTYTISSTAVPRKFEIENMVSGAPVVFGASLPNGETYDVDIKGENITIINNMFAFSSVKNITCRETPNLQFYTTSGTPDRVFRGATSLEAIYVNFVIKHPFYRPTESNGLSNLKVCRFKPNASTANITFLTNSSLLDDDSLVSVGNGLDASSPSTLSLHATPKAKLSTVMGTVSQVTDDTGTYDFFTADENGTVTLMDFITNTKGWTVA